MLSLMDIAYDVMSIEPQRVEYWTGLVLQVEDLLKGWRKSDRARYRPLLKNDGFASESEGES